MTSRELVYKTLEFNKPSRVPRQMWVLPWATEQYPVEVAKIQADFPDDIVSAPAVYKEPLKTVGQQFAVGTYTDEWGCVYQNLHSGIVGEVKDPLVKEWEDVEKVRVPEERLTLDVGQVNAFCKNTDKFVMGPCINPFERIQYLRGSENVYMDLALEEEGFMALLDKIHQYNLKEFGLWATTDVDTLFFMDDWGAQNSLLIAP
ncbi:MAG: methyltransferase, partial [Verrucomicrobiota bacterium]